MMTKQNAINFMLSKYDEFMEGNLETMEFKFQKTGFVLKKNETDYDLTYTSSRNIADVCFIFKDKDEYKNFVDSMFI